jgi:Tol biopolymer transport system component
LPIAGGKARRLTDDFMEPVKIDWSPDGKQILMQSYQDGMFHLYTIQPDGRNLRQLTRGDFDDIDPRWSPDGRRIIFVSERAGNRDLWILDVASGKATQVTSAGDKGYGPDVSAKASMLGVPGWISSPAWSPDGKETAFIRDRAIAIINLVSRQERILVPGPIFDVAAPSWSPDGKLLSYRQGGALWVTNADGSGNARKIGSKDDVFGYPATWLAHDELLYSANGRIWVSRLSGETREIPFEVTLKLDRPAYQRKTYDFDDRTPKPVKGILGPALSPTGDRIVFKALDDLWLVKIGGKAERITRDTYYEVDPSWSADGTRIAYASDKEGSPDIFVYDLGTGLSRRITSRDGAEIAPAWSPDGKHIAFETEAGTLAAIETASGKIRELMTGLNMPGRPSWSPDGKTILVAALHDARNHILAVDVESGRPSYFEPAPGRSISTRGDDGPIWSSDGRQLLFSMGSTLWILPVDAKGAPRGPARQLTRKASDAPSWNRDATRVLYLQNGVLELLDLESGKARTVDTGLTWTQEVPEQRMLIQAGRLWNGVDQEPVENVDILVVNNRIQEIRPRARAGEANLKVIDATRLTIVPGLFDMHVHQQMLSKFWGDRLGRLYLAYGITSTRSTGDHAYRALRDKESYASGTSVGPRHFMTGEMLDGKSLEWEFARPVEDAAQLELELSRAEALGYDVLKTYVRFPHSLQGRAIDAAHRRMGISVTTHYFYPGVAHGQDGAEHGGGPTRWDSANISSGGNYYEDVWPALTKTRFEVTTTNFSSAIGIAQDAGFIYDPRIVTLFPSWEWKSLEALLRCAQGKGPCGFLPPNEMWSRSAVQMMTRLMKAGVVVMAGTDSPLEYSYAAALQLNLRALARHGMTPFEALQTATAMPARAQGVEKDLGSLEAGKIADMVMVEGDPSIDMNDLARVRMVMKSGRLYTVEELMKPFAARAK